MRKRMRICLTWLLAFFMFFSITANSSRTSAYAEEKDNYLNLKSSDFEDTLENRNEALLEIDPSKYNGRMDKFSENPIFDITSNKLILPRMKGYKIEVFGSDRQPTISNSGIVTRPLVTQTVNILYKITDEKTGEVWETDVNSSVKIPGTEFNVFQANEKPHVVPSLREWIGFENTITLNENSKVVFDDENFKNLAELFAADYQEITGHEILLTYGTQSEVNESDIFFTNDSTETMLTEGAYYLEVGSLIDENQYITIRSNNLLGLSYGGVSLLQILKLDDAHNNVPRGIAKDYPQFEYRGYMLDAARKFIEKEYLLDTMKNMHWFKMNAFALHLSDNDIWESLSLDNGEEPLGFYRLESELYPELTSEQHYTKEEFREIQRYGSLLGVNVIPEIDTPGHTKPFTDVWPELKLNGQSKYLDVRNPQSLEIVKNLFDEYIYGVNGGEPTFIGNDVNIGTDEYKGGNAYKEDFRKYTDDLLKHISSTGKNPVLWGSLKENNGTTPVMSDAIMFAWYKGYADAKKSLKDGFRIVSMEDQETYIVPGGGWYSKQFGQAEHLYNNWLPNDNIGWANNPAPKGHPRVLGGQFAVWNDYTFNGISNDDISYRIQHNLYTVAQKTWSGDELKDDGVSYNEFSELALDLLDAPNSDFMYLSNSSDEREFVIDSKLNTRGDLLRIDDKQDVNTDVIIDDKTGFKLEESSEVKLSEESLGFDWTVSTWIRPEYGNNSVLLSGKTGTLSIKDGIVTLSKDIYKQSFDKEYYTYELADNTWNYITLTGTYEGVSLYINGEFIGDTIHKVYPNFNCTNNGAATSSDSNAPFNGSCKTPRYYQTLMLPTATLGKTGETLNATLKDFTILNRALSEQDVKEMAYDNGAISENVVYKNLALNKETSASGIEDLKFDHKYAVDGLGSNSANGTRWGSNYDSEAWFKVNLGEKKTVNQVVIDWEGAYGAEFKILVSEDDQTYTEVAHIEDGEHEIRTINFPDQENIQYVKFQGIRQFMFGYGYSFYEFEVYGIEIEEDETPIDYKSMNVAAFKDVTVTHYNNNSDGIERFGKYAVDESIETRWEFEPKNMSPNTITIPLNESENVNEIVITEQTWGNYLSRIKHTKIEAVKDDVIEVIFDGNHPTTIDDEIMVNGRKGNRTVFTFATTEADEIRMTFSPRKAGADDLVNINEIEMYGTKEIKDDDISSETLVEKSILHASVVNSSAYGKIKNIIDDNYDTYWSSTLNKTIQIDFEENTVIEGLSYHPTKDSLAGNITEFYLEVSYDGENFVKHHEQKLDHFSTVKKIDFEPIQVKAIRINILDAVKDVIEIAEINIMKSNLSGDMTVYLKNLVKELSSLDLDLYTKSSTKGLQELLDEAQTIISEGTDPLLMIEKLFTKKSFLKLKADTELLEQQCNDYKDLDLGRYTESSRLELEKHLDLVKEALERGDLSEEEMQELSLGLDLAIRSLVDISGLRNFVSTLSGLSSEDVKEGFNEFKLVYEQAVNIVEKSDSTLYDAVMIERELIDVYAGLESSSDFNKNTIKALTEEKENYTEKSWNEVSSDITRISSLLETNLTVLEMRDLRLELDVIKSKLVQVMLDESKFKLLLKDFENLIKDEYELENYVEIEDLVGIIKENLENEVYSQETLDEDVLKLAKLLEDLEKKVILEILTNLINSFESLYKEEYTEESYARVKELVDEITLYLESGLVTQIEVDQYVVKLQDAITDLEIKPVELDYVIIESLFEEIDSLNADLYTEESWNKLQEAYKGAKESYLDLTLQSEIDELVTQLKASVKDLVDKIIIDTSKLEALITEVEFLEKDEYTEVSWALIMQRLTEAKEVLETESTQEEIDAAWKALVEAKEALIEIVVLNTEELETLIEKAEKIDRNKYTEASLKDMDIVLQESKNLMSKINLRIQVTQEDVDLLAQRLEATIDALKLRDDVETPTDPEKEKPEEYVKDKDKGKDKDPKTGIENQAVLYTLFFVSALIALFLLNARNKRKV